MAIVGISGKMQSGKDTVALMWQYVDYMYRIGTPVSIVGWDDWSTIKDKDISNYWQIKYFAGKLRRFVSDITGISIEDLMKDEVKNTIITSFNKTPRQLLQLIGTEVCRVIDPDFHVIALMNDYIPSKGIVHFIKEEPGVYPNWLISDTRFPNELKAIEDRKGCVIRVERSWENRYPGITNIDLERPDLYLKHSHPSETSLDDHKFIYTIDNNGTLEELLNKVKLTYDLLIEKDETT